MIIIGGIIGLIVGCAPGSASSPRSGAVRLVVAVIRSGSGVLISIIVVLYIYIYIIIISSIVSIIIGRAWLGACLSGFKF